LTAGARHVLRLAPRRLRDPEVHDLHAVAAVAVLPDHDVVGLPGDARGTQRGQRALRLDDVGERLAFHELHRQVDQPLGSLAEVIDPGDVRVVDPAGVRRLAVEAADRVGVVDHAGIHPGQLPTSAGAATRPVRGGRGELLVDEGAGGGGRDRLAAIDAET